MLQQSEARPTRRPATEDHGTREATVAAASQESTSRGAENAPRTSHASHKTRASRTALARLATYGLGLGSLLAFVLCVVRSFDAGLAEMGVDSLRWTTYGFFASVVAVSAAVFALNAGPADGTRANATGEPVAGGTVAGRMGAGRLTSSTPTLALALAGAACLIGAAGLAMSLASGVAAVFSTDAALFVNGMFLGAGATVLGVRWFDEASRCEPNLLISSTAIAIALAGIVQGAFKLVRNGQAACAVIALLAIISTATAALLALDRKAGRTHDWTPADDERGRLLAAVCGPSRRLAGPLGSTGSAGTAAPRTRDVLAETWVALAGLAFCAFIMGLTWDPVLSEELDWRSATVEAPGTALGAIAGALVVGLAGRSGGSTRRLGMLVRAVQPVSIALVLVVPIVKQWVGGDFVIAISPAFSSLGFALLSSVAFVELAAVTRLSSANAPRCTAASLAVMAVAAVLGLASIATLGADGRALCFILEAIYFTAVAVYYAMHAHTGAGAVAGTGTGAEGGLAGGAEFGSGSGVVGAVSGGTGSPASGNASNGGLSDEQAFDRYECRCRQIAEEYRLSPRETDVLLYVGRGYGAAYIAPLLGISENTVRTHVRHIYEKLGVSSREELIARVDVTRL